MIACGHHHSLFIDPDGIVWASGYNHHGQLGLGNTEDQTTFCPIEGLPSAIQVSAAKSGNHSAILDQEGNVWMFGENICKCSQAEFVADRSTQQSLKHPSMVQRIYDNVMWWTFGENNDSQQIEASDDTKEDEIFERNDAELGIDDLTLQLAILSPTKVQNLPKITKVTCGCDHTIVLDNSGCIWGAGRNCSGQLSIEPSSVNEFTRIDISDNIGRVIDICCGAYFSIVQGETGKLWGSGNNSHGELGVGHYRNESYFQKMLAPAEDDFLVQSFTCGSAHTVVLDFNGAVWVTGHGLFFRLGIGDETNKNMLTKIQNIPPMAQIACGDFLTVMIDRQNGDLYTGGTLAGAVFRSFSNIPSKVEVAADLAKIVQVCISNFFAILVDEEGGVLATGSNEHGQLGLGDTERRMTFVQVEGVRADVKISEKKFQNMKRAR